MLHVGNAKEDGNVVSILEALIKSRRKNTEMHDCACMTNVLTEMYQMLWDHWRKYLWKTERLHGRDICNENCG